MDDMNKFAEKTIPLSSILVEVFRLAEKTLTEAQNRAFVQASIQGLFGLLSSDEQDALYKRVVDARKTSEGTDGNL